MTRRILGKFLQSEHGNFAILTALILTVMATMVGLAVDYTRGSGTRSDMQSALDAAALAAARGDGNIALATRQEALSSVYSGNEGMGSATVIGDVVQEGDYIILSAQADYDLPMSFMRVAGIESRHIRVVTKVRAPMRLMEIAFRFKEATGWWDKKVSLMGRKDGETDYQSLAEIYYRWNGLPGGLGNNVGNTTVKLMQDGAIKDVYERECPLPNVMSCKVVRDLANNKIDVSEMTDLYLQMEISAPTFKAAIDDLFGRVPAVPLLIRTDDPLLSDRLYVAGKQQPRNKKVDIFRIVGCGKEIDQEWEDGGKTDETDFAYSVQGFCQPSTRDRGVALAQ